MAMTLRLTDEEQDGLKACAADFGISMQEVARQAIREYIVRVDHRSRVAGAADHRGRGFTLCRSVGPGLQARSGAGCMKIALRGAEPVGDQPGGGIGQGGTETNHALIVRAVHINVDRQA
mgnify:CR=1 FL=1